MSIWKRPATVEALNNANFDVMPAHIGIIYTAIGEDYLSASMPVDKRTLQPAGILHGGASVVLAETLGSVAASLTVSAHVNVVGLEINANHIRAVREGKVYGTARPVHLGRSTQVWEIKIENELGKLTCISRITMAILNNLENKKEND